MSLVQLIKDNLKSNSVCPSSKPKKFKIVPLETRVERKISDHDIRGAVKIISSSDTLAQFNDENLNELKKKHPSPSRLLNFPPAPDDSTMPLQTNSVAVLKAIESFPSGTSGGLDSLSPQHLKDLTSISAGDAGVKLLSSITKLCNFLLAGKLIEDIRPLFFGASLCALTKKDGGLRPIAIGSTLRRLTAKIACFKVKDDLANYFMPHQLGFGVKLGGEAAIHSSRSFLMNPENINKVFLKIDYMNAFNSIERDIMLSMVREKVPELYSFLWQSYRHPSYLYFGNEHISSQVCAQQGDPAGPLLFSLAIHSLILL